VGWQAEHRNNAARQQQRGCSDEGVLSRFHGCKLGTKAPRRADEATKLAECDAFYERCGNWLRENTRDTKKFKILFDENVTYGFRRNLLGLKYAALIIDLVILGGCIVGFWRIIPALLMLASGATWNPEVSIC
jgi:hypothetical protein